MERRGLTNSGLVFSNEQKIRANTTTAIANYISDVQIQSALMKMASFEKALGAAGEYLGYLSQQSQLAYQPKYATWQAQQQANLAAYNARVQAKLTEYAQQMDVYKMQIAQAYEQQNMQLAHQLTMQELEFQANAEKDIIQMQIEANERAAKQAGKGTSSRNNDRCRSIIIVIIEAIETEQLEKIAKKVEECFPDIFSFDTYYKYLRYGIFELRIIALMTEKKRYDKLRST